MRKFILLAGTALGLSAGPVAACDLDGMFGPHRFNAFANLSGQSMFDPEPQTATPSTAPVPNSADNGEPVDQNSKPSTFATLSDQLDKEPTQPTATERSSWDQPQPVRANDTDDNGLAPSAMFR